MMSKRLRRIVCAVCCLSILLLSASCGKKKGEEPPKDYPVTVSGVILEECPQKVVSLSPSITDVIAALGSTAQLAGVDADSRLDKELPRVGSAAFPSTDEIIALAPDVILTNAALPENVAERLSLQEIPVIVIPAPANYAGTPAYFSEIAKVVSGATTGAANAQNTADRIDRKLAEITNALDGLAPVKVVCFLSSQAVATDDSLPGDILKLAGGVNLAESSTNYTMSNSEIAAASPDVILCPATLVPTLSASQELKDTPAVKNNRVTAISPAMLEAQGDSLVTAVEAIAKTLYPEAFPESVTSAADASAAQ